MHLGRTRRGQTALYYTKGRTPIIELILPKIANVDHRDEAGSSALARMASQGHDEAARLLLRAGASADLPDNQGDTPAHAACAAHHFDLALFLKSQMSNPSQKVRENGIQENGTSAPFPFPRSPFTVHRPVGIGGISNRQACGSGLSGRSRGSRGIRLMARIRHRMFL